MVSGDVIGGSAGSFEIVSADSGITIAFCESSDIRIRSSSRSIASFETKNSDSKFFASNSCLRCRNSGVSSVFCSSIFR